VRLVWAVIPLILLSIIGISEAEATICPSLETIFFNSADFVAVKGSVISSNTTTLDPPVSSIDNRFFSKRVTEYRIDSQIYGERNFDLDQITIEQYWRSPTESYDVNTQKIIPLRYGEYPNQEQKWQQFPCIPDYDVQLEDYINWIKGLEQDRYFKFDSIQHSFNEYLKTQKQSIQESPVREPANVMRILDEVGNIVSDVFVGKQYTIMDEFSANIDQEFVYVLQVEKDGQITQNSNMSATLSKGEHIILEFPWIPNHGSGIYIIKGTVFESFDSSMPLLPEISNVLIISHPNFSEVVSVTHTGAPFTLIARTRFSLQITSSGTIPFFTCCFGDKINSGLTSTAICISGKRGIEESKLSKTVPFIM